MSDSDAHMQPPADSESGLGEAPHLEAQPSDWHMRKGEVPKEAEKTKAALELHLHVLWCLLHQSTVPPKVIAEDKVQFNQHYLSEAQLQNSVTSSLDDNSGRIQNAKAKVAELLSSLSDGMIAANIRCIQECHLLLIFRTVACLGLAKWAPNVLSGDPESIYNLLHEHIALKTFEQVSAAYGYSHMGANLSCVHNFALMCKFYQIRGKESRECCERKADDFGVKET
ncbi:hypothetical protein L208DRAFT_1400718 [Tricholoma matsutake]|nr:hypothetical protein L208DRAFT_1400718 [Tricholoma matsutake 945]